jgi:hypothetical protein
MLRCILKIYPKVWHWKKNSNYAFNVRIALSCFYVVFK